MSSATNKILLLFLCVMNFQSVAQIEFTTYTKDNGLPSSNVLFTKIDNKGIIWAATTSGITAFTGKEWVQVKSISDNKGYNKNLGRVSRIFEATNGHIWVVTDKGLFIFNGGYWTFFHESDNDGFDITNIFEDRRGWIWVMLEKSTSLKDISDLGFSLREGKIQMFNGWQWFNYPTEIGGSAAVTIGDPMEYFTSHLQDTKGNIWITSLDGLYKFDSIVWVEFNEEELPSDKCYKVLETSNNEIWVATQYGIAKQSRDEWIKYDKLKGLKGNLIYDLLEDQEQRLWAITRKDSRFKSLCVYENGKWKAYFKDNIKIKGNIIQLSDFEDQLIAFSKKGVSAYDGKNWINLVKKFDIEDDDFICLTPAKNKTLWFAAQKGLYNLNDEGIKIAYSPEQGWRVTSIFESVNGKIWVGTEKNGVYIISGAESKNYTSENGLNDNHIIEIFEDKQMNIWVVTKTGISRFQ